MKKYVITILVFTFILNLGYAQEKKFDFNIDQSQSDAFKDSINLVSKNPTNNEEAFLLLKCAAYYFFRNADSTIYYEKIAENYANTHDFKRLQVYNHLYLSQVYAMMKSNYSLSTYYVNLAKKERDEFNLNESLIEEDIQALLLLSYSGLGSYSKVKKELDKQGPTIMQETYASSVLWNPVAMLAANYKGIGEYDSAIKYGLMAVAYNRKAPKQKKYGYTYYILADAYVHKADYQNAIKYLKEGFPYLLQNNFAKDISQGYDIYARAYFSLKQYDSAIFYGNIAYQMSIKIKYTNGILKTSELLSKIYEEKNQTDSAYKYLKTSSELKDILSDKSKVNEVENINLNEELREKQKQADASRRKKLIIGFSLFFIIGFTGLIFYNRYKQKVRARKQEEERKNNELKAARDLQISMLPKQNPTRTDLDIATFIRSSTEVGGDYYDFFLQDNGTIYSVCGDATGHGVTSGMMVSITKAGLNGIDAQSPSSTLQRLNNVVKKVDLGTLRMSLNIVEIAQDEVKLSSAAMPPIYLFKAKSSIVEEIMNSGLPLGGLKNEGFNQEVRSFDTGDVLVQLSDGLPEAPNTKGEMYDYDQLKNLIQASGHLTAQEIIDVLIKSVDDWMEGQHNPDDITLVVTKKK